MTSIKAISIGCISALALAGFGRQEPPPPQPPVPQAAADNTVECHWAAGTIRFDGLINERAWTNAEPIKLHVPWEKRPAKTAATARLLWDKEYLYFAAEMDDNDLYADPQDASRISDNDSFALYFKPHTNKLGYYEFQISAANIPMQVYFPSRGGGGYLRFAAGKEFDLNKQPGSLIESVIHLRGTLNDWTDKDKGWTIEGRIPWNAFGPTGGRPKAGDHWHFALCRRDYSVTLDNPEYSASAPLTVPNFHRYEEYQELLFMDRK